MYADIPIGARTQYSDTKYHVPIRAERQGQSYLSSTMKVLKRQISYKDGDGFVQMKTEEAEDMWHAYNLIAAGDRVRTSTVRKVSCAQLRELAQYDDTR